MTASNTDITIESTPESPAVSLPKMGEILREKREEKNLTVEDVSNRLRLSVRQIQALEANHFASFPEPMMTRGFIRNYARFLEIDADPLLQAYREYVPSESPHSLSLHSANVQLPINGQHSWGKYIVLLVVVALLAAGWVIYEDYLPHPTFVETPAPTAQTAAETAPANEPMPEAALPLAERENEQGVADASGNSVETTAPVAVPPASAAEATNPAPGQAGAKPAESLNQQANPEQANPEQAKPEQPKPQESSPVASLKLKTDAGTNLLKLKFTFTEESWVSVVDTDGNQVFNKTKPAGSQDVVEAKPPVKLVLGNAAGSQVSFQGKAIDLAPYTRLNVARLTLAVE